MKKNRFLNAGKNGCSCHRFRMRLAPAVAVVSASFAFINGFCVLTVSNPNISSIGKFKKSGIGIIRIIRLVIGRINNNFPIVLDPPAKSFLRMIQLPRFYLDRPNREIHLIIKTVGINTISHSFNLLKRNWKHGLVHLPLKAGLGSRHPTRAAVKIPPVFNSIFFVDVKRTEERKTLNMIPMDMGNKKVNLKTLFLLHLSKKIIS